jgi:hypothetical protein
MTHMTFGECLARLKMLADGVKCHLKLEAWNDEDVNWIAYRQVSWDGDRCHISADTPERLLERVRDALATTTPPKMTAEQVRP